jgi:hypothetical protein
LQLDEVAQHLSRKPGRRAALAAQPLEARLQRLAVTEQGEVDDLVGANLGCVAEYGFDVLPGHQLRIAGVKEQFVDLTAGRHAISAEPGGDQFHGLGLHRQPSILRRCSYQGREVGGVALVAWRCRCMPRRFKSLQEGAAPRELTRLG